MKISVITATFNSEATVRDTIESVLKQTHKDIEYIIKDGGSKDKTLDICREYEPSFNGRMRIISCPDKGIYDAMNQGIIASSGEVVGLLNSDDFYQDENVLKDMATSFEREKVDCVHGKVYLVDAADTNKLVRDCANKQYYEGIFNTGWHPHHPTFYVKRYLYEKYGMFDISLNVSADFELMLRFLERYHASSFYMDRYIIRMRQGGESTGSIKRIIEGNKNVLLAFQKNGLKVPPFYLIRRLFPKIMNVIKTKFAK